MSNNQTNNIQNILLTPPEPLFYSEKNLVLFWSARAGCTFMVKWFFFQMGFLKIALFYDPWVHKFRTEVFNKSHSYRENIESILSPKTQIIKCVRNPYSRAVSSFIQAGRCSYVNNQMSSFLGRDVSEHSFSFREFVNFLETINLKTCDIHHRVQVHRSETEGLVKPNFLIKIENSFPKIRTIEKQLELKKSPLQRLRESPHHTKRRDFENLCADDTFKKLKHLKNSHSSKSFPLNTNFYDDELQEKVANLYKIDFETYNYDLNVIPDN